MRWYSLYKNIAIDEHKYNKILLICYVILGFILGYTTIFLQYLSIILLLLLIIYIVFKSTTYSHFEHRLQQIFYDTPIAIYAINKNGIIKYCNSFLCKLFNCTKQDLIEQKYNDLNYNKLHGNHEINIINFDFPQSNLLKYQYHLIVNLPYNIHMINKKLIDNSPIATAIIDNTGKIQEFNSAFQRVTEMQEPNTKNYNIFNIVDVNNKNDLYNTINIALQRIQDIPSKPIEVKISTKNNITALLYITLDISELSTQQLFCHLIDITEQKNLEMHFIHAQKIQLLGQLTGGIAHDFNNLLTGMAGFCDLLLMRHSPDDQSFADIMQIKQNTNRAINLVRQLLLFSRKQHSQPEIIDITNILDELSNLLRRLIGNNIKLDIQHGNNLYKVKIDPGQLEQIIINLAVNARDAMNNNGLLVIRTSNIDIINESNIEKELINPFPDIHIEPGNYVLLEIEDSGCGIADHLLSKIFEPFFSTKEADVGTGLGLFTVHNILRHYDSYIYITTSPNQGTKFSIFLKSHDTYPVMTSTTLPTTSNLSSSDLVGSGTILIIEDEPPIRMLAAHALMNKGYKVLEASSGMEALLILNQFHDEIILIITDIMMPELSGADLIEQIHKAYPNISVIFISGYNDSTILNTTPLKNQAYFLPKPFSLHQLISVVKEVLNKN